MITQAREEQGRLEVGRTWGQLARDLSWKFEGGIWFMAEEKGLILEKQIFRWP